MDKISINFPKNKIRKIYILCSSYFGLKLPLWSKQGEKFRKNFAGDPFNIIIKITRSAVVHFNFQAESTFPVPVCTVPHGHWVNKADNQQN